MKMSDNSIEQSNEVNKPELESGADTGNHVSLITDFDIHLFQV